MGRSLSDDPVKLERELSGLTRRAIAIRNKLDDLERPKTEEVGEVVTGDEAHRRWELLRGVHRGEDGALAELRAISGPAEMAGEVDDEWGAF